MTKTTPVYGLPYPEPADPVNKNYKDIEGIAKKTEAALSSKNTPPDNSDLQAIIARLNAIESGTADTGWLKNTAPVTAANTKITIGNTWVRVFGPVVSMSFEWKTSESPAANSAGGLSYDVAQLDPAYQPGGVSRAMYDAGYLGPLMKYAIGIGGAIRLYGTVPNYTVSSDTFYSALTTYLLD